jgi:hypothetical protein
MAPRARSGGREGHQVSLTKKGRSRWGRPSRFHRGGQWLLASGLRTEDAKGFKLPSAPPFSPGK